MEARNAELTCGFLSLHELPSPFVATARGLLSQAPAVLVPACCSPSELLGTHMCPGASYYGWSDTWLMSCQPVEAGRLPGMGISALV